MRLLRKTTNYSSIKGSDYSISTAADFKNRFGRCTVSMSTSYSGRVSGMLFP
jgi:hypothetical protein